VTPSLFRVEVELDRLDDRPRPCGQAREHPAAVLDRDLKRVAFQETRFSSQPVDFAENFPLRPSSSTTLRSSVGSGLVPAEGLLDQPRQVKTSNLATAANTDPEDAVQTATSRLQNDGLKGWKAWPSWARWER